MLPLILIALLAGGVAVMAAGTRKDEDTPDPPLAPEVTEEIERIVEAGNPPEIAAAAKTVEQAAPKVASELQRVANVAAETMGLPPPPQLVKPAAAPVRPEPEEEPEEEPDLEVEAPEVSAPKTTPTKITSPGWPALPATITESTKSTPDPREAGISPELAARVEKALTSVSNVEKLESLAEELEAGGHKESAIAVRTKIATLQSIELAAKAAKEIEEKFPELPASLAKSVPTTEKVFPEPEESEPEEPIRMIEPTPEDPDPVDKANAKAQTVADALRGKAKGTEDRALVRRFQQKIGMDPVDGMYGPRTRVKLAVFGVDNPPPSLYIPNTGGNPRRWCDEHLGPFEQSDETNVARVAREERAKVLRAFGIA